MVQFLAHTQNGIFLLLCRRQHCTGPGRVCSTPKEWVMAVAVMGMGSGFNYTFGTDKEHVPVSPTGVQLEKLCCFCSWPRRKRCEFSGDQPHDFWIVLSDPEREL